MTKRKNDDGMNHIGRRPNRGGDELSTDQQDKDEFWHWLSDRVTEDGWSVKLTPSAAAEAKESLSRPDPRPETDR